MFWNLSGKQAPGKGSHRKTRKLRLESVEPRQMLSGSPIGHVLYGPVSPVQHEPFGSALHGPITPGQHGHVSHGDARHLQVRPIGPEPIHGLPIHSGPGYRHADLSESISTEEFISLPGSDLFALDTVRVTTKVEADGVTRVTVDVTEDVYAGRQGGRLVAEEDVKVVAEVQGAGDLQIDVRESELVATRSGRGLKIENPTQSVDVIADISSAGNLSLTVNESETVLAPSQRQRGMTAESALAMSTLPG